MQMSFDRYEMSMRHKLPLGIMIMLFFLTQAQAEAGDPLDPGQLGESMSMPLSPELIQAAVRAGVITESNSLEGAARLQPSFSAGPRTESDQVNSMDNVNVTGIWSLDLSGQPDEQMRLRLVQSGGMIMGQGTLIRGDETVNATVSGSASADILSLIVMPVGELDLYRLNLSLSTLSAGTYTAYMADGSSRSGEVTFSVSSNIFQQPSADSRGASNAYANGFEAADSTSSSPVMISAPEGLKGRISTQKTTSMSSNGGSMISSSSMSSI